MAGYFQQRVLVIFGDVMWVCPAMQYIYFTFIFIHFAYAFIQSDL